MNDSLTRRNFIRRSALAVAATAVIPWARGNTTAETHYRHLVRDRKVRIAVIGAGGRGHGNLHGVAGEDIVALCDVDFRQARRAFQEFLHVPRYRDFRAMLDEMDEQIDAVVISTPDHMHYPPALMAIERGKHVYIEKPLTHTVGEARALKAAAAKAGIVSQMGNQGHANEGTRRVKEWIAAGAIGTVREVHSWSDRPIWPQGIELPRSSDHPPETLDWNLWLGVAPDRAFAHGIAPFRWRGFWDYGCGALGDMGCHLMDAPFWALDLRGSVKITARSSGNSAVCAPRSSVVRYRFPERDGRPALDYYWYDGGEKPPLPPGFAEGAELPNSGSYYLGDDGVLYSPGDQSTSPRLLPEERMRSFERPAPTLPRVPRANAHHEWINAIKGGEPAGSDIVTHSADLTEFCLLGNLAIRFDTEIDWDGEAGVCRGLPEADRLIHKSYRLF
ncbi:MAG: gfo/Idh/MocA family oxidoreductase [Puniceicoccaceae bacterium]|nr:MAG: gfo/Idh/MocA family oxidoreductase [Puniceicoccaceae bacterium]